MNDLITIGIPSYNQAQYLPDAIESALRQAAKCEILVVDDGSTDNSIEIASRYPVRLITQINKGLSSARNTLIMNCHTPYLLPLDADDMLYDNCVEKILQRIKETSATIIAPSFKNFGVMNDEVILGKNPTLESFKDANRIGYFSAFSVYLAKLIGGYSPRMIWGWEDWHFWINMLSRGATISVIQEPLVLYRTKPQSMYTDSLKHSKELMNQIKKDFPSLYA